MPVDPDDVWRSLPASLRKAVADDLAAVLREMIDGLGTRKAASSAAGGDYLCSPVDPASGADHAGEPSSAIRAARPRPPPRLAWGGQRGDRLRSRPDGGGEASPTRFQGPCGPGDPG